MSRPAPPDVRDFRDPAAFSGGSSAAFCRSRAAFCRGSRAWDTVQQPWGGVPRARRAVRPVSPPGHNAGASGFNLGIRRR
jgi:hypothetical protein